MNLIMSFFLLTIALWRMVRPHWSCALANFRLDKLLSSSVPPVSVALNIRARWCYNNCYMWVFTELWHITRYIASIKYYTVPSFFDLFCFCFLVLVCFLSFISPAYLHCRAPDLIAEGRKFDFWSSTYTVEKIFIHLRFKPGRCQLHSKHCL